MGRYDGPSYLKNKKVHSNRSNPDVPIKKTVQPEKIKTERSRPQENNYAKKQIKIEKDFQSEIRKYSNKSTQFKGTHFRAREIPSPVYGYSQEQKERLARFKKPNGNSRKWDYDEIGNRLSLWDDEYILIDGYQKEESTDEKDLIEDSEILTFSTTDSLENSSTGHVTRGTVKHSNYDKNSELNEKKLNNLSKPPKNDYQKRR